MTSPTDLTPAQADIMDRLKLRQEAERQRDAVQGPKPIGEQLPEDLAAQREATCPDCQSAFTQVRMFFDWVPARCERCRGETTRVLQGADATAEARLRLEELGVPPLYAGVTLESFRLHGTAEEQNAQERILIMARRYLTDWPDVPPVVVFRGGPGTGKGHVAWSLAKQLVQLHPARTHVCKLPNVIRDLREAWRGEGGPSEAQRLARYHRPDLLIIDEVSRHAFYGEPHRHLYDLLDHRLEWCRPTILTTNETAQGLAELLLPALTSRAGQTGLWGFGGVDYRLRGAAA